MTMLADYPDVDLDIALDEKFFVGKLPESVDGRDELLRALLEAVSRLRIPRLMTELDALRELRTDWDGNDSEPPNATAIASCGEALMVASSISAEMTLIPSAEGGVAMRWDIGDAHAYIEFGNDGDAISVFYRGIGEPEIYEFTPNASQSKAAIEAIEAKLAR